MLKFKTLARLGTTAGMLGYEANKHRKKRQGNLTDRGNVVQRVAQGDIPGQKAVQEGAAIAGEVAQFLAVGDISNMNAAPIAQAAVIDTAKNTAATIKNSAKAAAILSTTSSKGIEEIKGAVNTKVEDAMDSAIVGVGVGSAGSLAIDAASAVAPLPLKPILQAVKAVWIGSGIVNQLGKLEEIAHDPVMSHETSKEVYRQIIEQNKATRKEVYENLARGMVNHPTK